MATTLSGVYCHSMVKTPPETDAARALDTVDRFIAVGRGLAEQEILATSKYANALEHVIEVIQMLLVANENMVRWLNKFTQFDFRAKASRKRFLGHVAKFKTAKSGPELRQMKWPCGDIRHIYDTEIRPDMADMFVQVEATPEELDAAFAGLSDADEDMVAFIYDAVVGGIEDFLKLAEPAVDAGDFDAAEQARLEFKVHAQQLSERLERLGGGLADLLLDYSRLAGRRVRLS